MTNLDSILKNSAITLPAKVHLVKAMVFPEVTQMSELDHEEGWVLKNWCFWYVVLEKILASHLDCKEIKPVNPKGNQPWIFTGRIDAEAEAPILSTYWKWCWCWKRLRAAGEEDNREWDGWMASSAQLTCVCTNSRR